MHCLIVASMAIAQPEHLRAACKVADAIIAADAGYLALQAIGVPANMCVGDYDSAPPPNALHVITLPKEKDDTDTYFAARQAIALGASVVSIYGGLGGRLDHTFANLQTLIFLAQNNVEAWLVDDKTRVTVLLQGSLKIKRSNVWVSVFPVGTRAQGVSLQGLKYSLEDATLCNSFPVGVSNEFAQPQAEISVKTDGIYIMLSVKE